MESANTIAELCRLLEEQRQLREKAGRLQEPNAPLGLSSHLLGLVSIPSGTNQ